MRSHAVHSIEQILDTLRPRSTICEGTSDRLTALTQTASTTGRSTPLLYEGGKTRTSRMSRQPWWPHSFCRQPSYSLLSQGHGHSATGIAQTVNTAKSTDLSSAKSRFAPTTSNLSTAPLTSRGRSMWHDCGPEQGPELTHHQAAPLLLHPCITLLCSFAFAKFDFAPLS